MRSLRVVVIAGGLAACGGGDETEPVGTRDAAVDASALAADARVAGEGGVAGDGDGGRDASGESDPGDAGSLGDSSAAPGDAGTQQVTRDDASISAMTGVCIGNFSIQTDADLEALRGCTRITGNLRVSSADSLTDLTLPNLTSVGSLAVNQSNHGVLSTLNFPALSQVEQDVDLRNAPSVSQLDLSALKAVGGSLTISYVGVATCSLPQLTASAGVNINTMTKLIALELPVLARTKYLYLSVLSTLTSLGLPALAAIDEGFGVDEARKLGSVSFPLLGTVGGGFELTRNGALTTPSFPQLHSVGGNLTISGVPMLPTCRAEALRAQLGTNVGTVSISGTSDAGPCP